VRTARRAARAPYDHVLMFRILVLHGLSLADRVPDANSIWTFREALTRSQISGVPAIEALFRRFGSVPPLDSETPDCDYAARGIMSIWSRRN